MSLRSLIRLPSSQSTTNTEHVLKAEFVQAGTQSWTILAIVVAMIILIVAAFLGVSQVSKEKDD